MHLFDEQQCITYFYSNSADFVLVMNLDCNVIDLQMLLMKSNFIFTRTRTLTVEPNTAC